jgi:hypothetical protein
MSCELHVGITASSPLKSNIAEAVNDPTNADQPMPRWSSQASNTMHPINCGAVMKRVSHFALLISILLFSIASYAESQINIPPGTVFPLQLNSTVKSNRARAGERITGEIMQDVPLPDGSRIRRGAKVVGHVTAAQPSSAAKKGEISLRFDMVIEKNQRVPVITHLRAMASLMAVSEAQVPESGPDRGTPSYIWTTDLIGGQINYHGGGLITHGNEVVGHSTPYGVLVRAGAIPGTRCRSDGHRLQAFWVFSSYACGIYDYGDLVLVHAGPTEPLGDITIQAAKGNVNLRSGSGMLLRVQ